MNTETDEDACLAFHFLRSFRDRALSIKFRLVVGKRGAATSLQLLRKRPAQWGGTDSLIRLSWMILVVGRSM
jgi:hypothetical protein